MAVLGEFLSAYHFDAMLNFQLPGIICTYQSKPVLDPTCSCGLASSRHGMG